MLLTVHDDLTKLEREKTYSTQMALIQVDLEAVRRTVMMKSQNGSHFIVYKYKELY
jgi:hypothetical protein